MSKNEKKYPKGYWMGIGLVLVGILLLATIVAYFLVGK